ncbi:MAG: alpha/beta hydrolase [Burkholderiales bacterium]|nr:alpha/beta hydrolase [Burkholderiales bacterium]
MAAQAQQSPYFMYFPDDYRWSAAIVNMLGSATFGSADVGEIHQIGRLVQAKVGDDDAWFDACWKVGQRVRALADERAANGHKISAANFYRRACVILQMGERFRTPKDERALAAYRLGVDCFQRFAELTTDTRIEVVEVPYEGGTLPGYFVHANNSTRSRNPCVVFFDGLDVTKELQYSRGVEDLVKRGMSCLVMDGPGTGEAIRFRNCYLRPDYEVAGSACIDYLERRADVDAERIGVMAISLGGYYAPRCASMEPRFAACVAWGAIWDYYATWKRRIDAGFKTSLSVPGHHIMWILGVDTLDAALKKLEPFKLDGVVQKMRCPLLITHGADDEQVPLADAQALYQAAGSADKTLRVFDAEQGGAQHCQRDYLSLGVATMFDWLEDRLVRAR